jgi:hypothetical protein
MIDLLGLLIFATVVGIGLLDLRSGLSPFALYRSTTVAGVRRRRPSGTRRRGDDNRPRPPASTR